jgi:hypothetical protein
VWLGKKPSELRGNGIGSVQAMVVYETWKLPLGLGYARPLNPEL